MTCAAGFWVVAGAWVLIQYAAQASIVGRRDNDAQPRSSTLLRLSDEPQGTLEARRKSMNKALDTRYWSSTYIPC